MEEAWTRIVENMGEQNEQMSIRKWAIRSSSNIESESPREEINRKKQEVSKSEKRLKERKDEQLARNWSRMTREAEKEKNDWEIIWSNVGVIKSRLLILSVTG